MDDLSRRIGAEPPPTPDEIREALDRIADMALALWGDEEPPAA